MLIINLKSSNLCAGTPSPPLNIQSFVQEYHNHFSTVIYTWDAPHGNQRVEYYQYQLVNETSIIVDHNTSNTSAIVSGIPYNENITLVVLAHNCIGSSPPSVEEVYIGMCTTRSAIYCSYFNILRLCMHQLFLLNSSGMS